jgi:hypothetical protein
MSTSWYDDVWFIKDKSGNISGEIWISYCYGMGTSRDVRRVAKIEELSLDAVIAILDSRAVSSSSNSC